MNKQLKCKIEQRIEFVQVWRFQELVRRTPIKCLVLIELADFCNIFGVLTFNF